MARANWRWEIPGAVPRWPSHLAVRSARRLRGTRHSRSSSSCPTCPRSRPASARATSEWRHAVTASLKVVHPGVRFPRQGVQRAHLERRMLHRGRVLGSRLSSGRAGNPKNAGTLPLLASRNACMGRVRGLGRRHTAPDPDWHLGHAGSWRGVVPSFPRAARSLRAIRLNLDAAQRNTPKPVGIFLTCSAQLPRLFSPNGDPPGQCFRLSTGGLLQ